MKVRLIYIVTVWICICGSLSIAIEYDKITVKFYSGTSSRIYSDFRLSDINQLMTHKSFDKRRPTALYIFGWLQTVNSDVDSKLIDAYVRRGGYNFLVFDWSDYNTDLYSTVEIRVPEVGRKAANAFLKLFNNGLNDQTFHCVGHSFGAHACGFMGRKIQESSKGRFKIGRITGLDPSKFKTYSFGYEKPLQPSDAVFVDTIQSDGFFIGTRIPLGHVTFLPNNADVQPGCPPFRNDNFYNYISSYCSHLNAIRYWTQSLDPNRPHFFPAYKCSNWNDYMNGYCSKNPINYMGLDANPNTPGVFYLKLKSKKFFNHDKQYFDTNIAIGKKVAILFLPH
ncbi:phospholipase A1 member A-like [Chironomus tepperi]|uniref:phospholipase A1 member A-like n=1 Tax=Chironomus tepperi TaxID=113505 RepID=UPI00391FC4B0